MGAHYSIPRSPHRHVLPASTRDAFSSGDQPDRELDRGLYTWGWGRYALPVRSPVPHRRACRHRHLLAGDDVVRAGAVL